MDDFVKKQIQEKLTRANNIAVFVSKDGGFDPFASGLALFLSLKKIGKNSSVFAKSPTVADAQLMYGVDSIGKSSAKKNLVITIDNAIKTVDKVTHFLDGNKLKLVVHAFADSNGVSEEEISFEKTATKPDIIFSLGYKTLEELKKDVTQEQNLDPNTTIINVNNNQESQKFAQYEIIKSASFAEIISDILVDLALPLDEDIAFNLYAALASFTKMFSPQLVSASTFEVAQTLVKFGAGKANLAQRSKQNLEEQLRTDEAPKKPRHFNFDIVNKPLISPTTKNLEEQTPIEEVEKEKEDKEAWLKPPKIYRGSKSFDRES